jgi:O-antigen/teichoic acid export membrane protein
LSPELHLLKSPLNSALFLLFSVAASIAGLIGIAFVAIRKAKLYFLQSLLIGSRILFIIPLVFLGTMGIFSSVGVSFILASLLLLFPLMQAGVRPQPAVDKEFIRTTYHFSVGNYLTNLFMSAPTYILPLMVLNLLGADATAYFYVTLMIASLLYMIPNAVSTSLFVEGSHGEALKTTVLKSIYAIFLLLIPAIVLLYLFGDFVLGLVGKDYSMSGFELLKVMVIASVFVAVNTIFSSIKRVQKEVKQLLLLNGVTSLLLLALSYVFMLNFGLIGAGYAWIISYGISAVIVGLLVWREKWI